MRRFAQVAVVFLLTLPAGVASADANIAALQIALRNQGLYAGSVDGVAGPGTRAAVARFQAKAGLVADGVAGAATRTALGRAGRPPLGSRPLGSRMAGWDVAGLQFLLAVHGFPSGTMDGSFGSHTLAALQRFQAWAGLGADGVAGAGTVARLAGPAPVSPLRFALPIQARVGDGFGPRGGGFHPGLDFPAPTGTPVVAAGRGCVSFAGWDAGGYGNTVAVRHRMGMVSMYAHLSRIDVRPGQCLVAGNRVGLVGSTGFSTGPHLHFELRLRGAAVDPRTGL